MKIESHEIAELMMRLAEAAEELEEMVEAVAKARQINTWDSERRRAALSKQVAPLLGTNGVSAAEHLARASSEYVNAMRLLQVDLYEAEKTLARYETVKCRWESARSILSAQRAIAGNL